MPLPSALSIPLSRRDPGRRPVGHWSLPEPDQAPDLPEAAEPQVSALGLTVATAAILLALALWAVIV